MPKAGRHRLVILMFFIIATPLIVAAQPSGKVWRIAYLSLAEGPDPIDAVFDAAAKKLGYVDGQNVVMDRRFLGKGAVAPDEVMQEVVRRNPDVMVTWAIQWSAAA